MFPRLFTVPAAFGFGPFTLHTYGAILAVAFVAGLLVASWQARKAGLDASRVTDMAVWVLIAGLVGAKLMLLGVEWRYFVDHPGTSGPSSAAAASSTAASSAGSRSPGGTPGATTCPAGRPPTPWRRA